MNSHHTETESLATVLHFAEARLANLFFTFGKGVIRAGEPLYGFTIYAPVAEEDPIPIVEVEHNDPIECIRMAISRFDALSQ